MTLSKLIGASLSFVILSLITTTQAVSQDSNPTPGFLGEYYKNTNLKQLVSSRNDRDINFNWGKGSPMKGIPSDQFSVRWSGLFTAPHRSGTRSYRFTTNTDDGVKLDIGNKTIINEWTNQSAGKHSQTISLRAGQSFPLLMEYYENTGAAFAYLTITDMATGAEVPIIKTVVTPNNEIASKPQPTSSNTVSLTWTAPLTRMNGTSIALSEIDHYVIRYGKNVKNLSEVHKVGGDETAYSFQNLPLGHWHFRITVVDDRGLQSPPSPLVSKNLE